MNKEKLKAELLTRYPFPCTAECKQTEACEYHKKCGTWLGWDFCLKRDIYLILKRQERRKQLMEEIKEEALWDDMERL